MMQKNISLADVGKDIIVIHESRDRLWRIGRLFQVVKTAHAVHLHEEGEIQRTADLVNVFTADGKLPF